MTIVVAVTDKQSKNKIFFLFKNHDAAELFILLINDQYQLEWARVMNTDVK